MSEFDNGQSPFETEAERVARERKEKVAGFRLNIDPEEMVSSPSYTPKRKAPPLRREEEPAIHTVPSAFRHTPTSVEDNEEKPVQKSPDAVNAIAAAVAAKLDEEGDIAAWNRPVQPEEKPAQPEEKPQDDGSWSLPENPKDEAPLNTVSEPSDSDSLSWAYPTKPEDDAVLDTPKEATSESPLSEKIEETPAETENPFLVAEEAPQPSPEIDTPVYVVPIDDDAPVRILDEEEETPVDPNAPVHILDEEEPYVGKEEKHISCMGVIFYLMCVLAVSCVLAFIGVTSGLDMLGLNKSDDLIDITIPEGADSKEVAAILHEKDIVNRPLIFRLFSKVTHADGHYYPGEYTIAANSGYQSIISQLQTEGERETVTITIPEGYNVKDIAKLLDENGVCEESKFLSELEEGDFSAFSFVSEIPEVGEGTKHPYRIYRFEGYLFPDTYTFYKDCSPHSAIEKFFENFESRVDTKMMSTIKANDMELDGVIILASILQMEADNRLDMERMACVFHNRLNDPANFPQLQSDVTTEYVENFIPDADENNLNYQAYSTYNCEGLPTGPICNPGLAALNAVINPSEESDIVNCCYFATDTSVDPTVTYYSETFDEHMAICRKYGIGVHGE